MVDTNPGESGLGGTNLLPEPTVEAIHKPNAVLAMRNELIAQPKNTAWLVATGALTNVALLFAVFPELVEHIKGLSIMGGVIGSGFTKAILGKTNRDGEQFGNISPTAEFNIYVRFSYTFSHHFPFRLLTHRVHQCDPEAAQAIFSNPKLAAKTVLIPLDLTHLVLGTLEVQQKLLHNAMKRLPLSHSNLASNLRHLFYDLLTFFAKTYDSVFGVSEGPPLHDPIAVAVLLDTLFDSSAPKFNGQRIGRFHVDIKTEGKHSDVVAERGQMGRTEVHEMKQEIDDSGVEQMNGVKIPRNIDIDWFWGLIYDALSRAEEALNVEPFEGNSP